jgi:hypothetical protein
MQKQRLPDLPDMMKVGMGLTEALAFWNQMMNAPDRDQRDWWEEIAEISRRRRRALQ